MMIGLTGVLLLTVVLAFNLAVYGFVRSRVSAQLSNVAQSASTERRSDKPVQPFEQEQTSEADGGERFDEHPDRVMGTRGSAVVLDSDGSMRINLHGDETAAEALSEWYRNRCNGEIIQNKIVFLDSGTYFASTESDPYTSGQIILSYVDVTSVMAFTRLINIMLLLVILTAILFSILLSRRFARSFSNPVKSLSEFAENIGDGNLETRELEFRDLEFDTLAESMNRMTSDLKNAQKKQEIFFQNVSHELRTPLTSIRGNAEGVLYGLMEPKVASKVILSESDKLSGLVEDILFLSRAGKEKQDGEAEPIDLRDVLSLCVSEQRTEAEKKGVSFDFAFDDEPVIMRIRQQDAERMVGNLLSNAIRYAEKTITLTCKNESDSLLVSVKDDGPGVSPEDLPHVFERMYKGSGGKHGIGLAIAQAVAEGHGGMISVRNEVGAVFEARFPRDQLTY